MCHPTDARIGGRYSHWEQPRDLSIMEVRWAQGIPDGEVLLGTTREQWAMVGNGVARGISMALGLSLREAWLGTLYEDDGSQGGKVAQCGVSEQESTSSLDIPWSIKDDDDDDDDEGQIAANDHEEDNKIYNLLPSFPTNTAPSRTATPSSPGLVSDESGLRFYSTTPTTSLAETHRSDESSRSMMTGNKRPLSKMVAEGLVSASTAFKKQKMAEHNAQVALAPTAFTWPMAADQLVEDGLLLLEEPAASRVESGAIESAPEQEELALLESSNPTEQPPALMEEKKDREKGVVPPPPLPDDLPPTVNGFTVVRMSSEDLMDE